MGAVTGPPCSSRSGQLAMYVLDRLGPDERDEVDAHLVNCEACRATTVELASTVGALDALALPGAPAPVAEVPPDLTRAVFADLRSEPEAPVVRRHRVRWAATVGVPIAAVAAAVAALVVGGHHAGPPTRTVALHGTPGVTASAVLVEQAWGTSLTVRERGLPPGSTYTVSMDDAAGRWWTAGSYRTTGSVAVQATMACAASYDSVHGIRVTDAQGRTVLYTAVGGAY